MGTRAELACTIEETLIQLVGGIFASDPSRASVLFSRLADGTWYGSIQRYNQPYGEGREVLARATSRLREGVLVLLARELLAHALERVPGEALAHFLLLTEQLYDSLSQENT